ncbi:hypothetical protein T492DRAFT_929958 [Pavlovales sp. CCMP2436]|nr:hypothetical protein T492DRAFT_929958 [Pavlovales sp. CCMP2436]
MVYLSANAHLLSTTAPLLLLVSSTWPERVSASADEEQAACVAFRRTTGCSPAGARDSQMDAGCDELVRSEWSGFCECAAGAGFTTMEVGCGHVNEFTCAQACSERWRQMQGVDASAASEEVESAPRSTEDVDSDLEKLYRRGKQFYVVGNIELAIRHYREALRSDPDHKASKADYKKLKKLQRAMAEAESKLPRTVEGGRKVQLEQRENAETALKYLDEALAVAPPAVYRAELFAHLCKCHTTLKNGDKATHSCAEHKRLDGSREGRQLIEKLKPRAGQVDYYKILGIGRSATEKELKRAYHKMAVQYHPDKYAAKSEADAAEADKKFKEIARAYEVLGDEELRRKYDLGEDPDEQQQGGGQRGGNFRPMHHGGQRVHVHFG